VCYFTAHEHLEKGYHIRRNGISNYTINKNSRIIFLGPIPDHTDDIKSTKDIPSWKRMCYCIMKNDHTCRFMHTGILGVFAAEDICVKKGRQVATSVADGAIAGIQAAAVC